MSEIKNLLAKMINKINSNEDRIENMEENGVGGGVSSWNDLTDKPFYSEVTEVVTNVLEWDGDTDGLVSVEFNSNLIFYKISDVIPKKNDLIGGSVYFRPISNPDMGENSLEITDDLVMTETEDILVLSEGMVVVVKKSGATFQNIQFEEVGVYFIVMTNNNVYSSKLEATSDIFTVTNEVVHKLDPKYLPEGYPYVEEGEMVEILPETQAIAMEDDMFALLDAINGVEVGGTYTVTYNGVDYECTANLLEEDGISFAALGDGTSFGFTGNGEPFFMLVVPPELVASMGVGAQMLSLDGSTSVTIAISGVVETIHKMDNKYIDTEWMATNKKGTLLWERQLAITTPRAGQITNGQHFALGQLQKNTGITVTNGQLINVECNGKLYSCTALAYGDIVLIGNLYFFIDNVENTGEPFLFNVTANQLFTQFAGQYDICVYIDGEANDIPVTMPIKFLPTVVPSMTIYDTDAITISDRTYYILHKNGEPITRDELVYAFTHGLVLVINETSPSNFNMVLGISESSSANNNYGIAHTRNNQYYTVEYIQIS